MQRITIQWNRQLNGENEQISFSRSETMALLIALQRALQRSTSDDEADVSVEGFRIFTSTN